MYLLPELLRTRLVDAGTVLERSGHVPIWHRQAIYAALGSPQPLIPIDLASVSTVERQRLEKAQRDRGGIPVFHSQMIFGKDRTPGHIRRTALAIRTVEYDFPIWHNPNWHLSSTRDAIQRIMAIVRQVYAGQQPEPQAIDGLFISVFDAFHTEDVVWAAAGRAYDVAVADVDLELDPLPPFRSDKELNAFRHDVAGVAAIAAEAQAPAFWHWWLTSAVPAAWLAHPGDQ
jgi:hypothetical protein